MNKVCIVTSTRAEYGLLRNIIELVFRDDKLELCLMVTGTHLSAKHGMTISEIESDGYPIAEKINILMDSEDADSISKTMGLAIILFADAFKRNTPDILVLLGDRYELLAVASAAMNNRIPIAHIAGGEITEGVIDESVRHCLTKMSHLHFTSCDIYRKRVIQLGETPDRVYNFGDVAVENVKKTVFLTKAELEKSLKFNLSKPYFCVTYHPVTLEFQKVEEQVEELLKAIQALSKSYNFIFTKANADEGGETINTLISEYVSKHRESCRLYSSLGSRRYLSLLKYSNGIIGNSSSGIVEATVLRIPTINIGSRQKGRIQADSIINCRVSSDEIIYAIKQISSDKFKQIMKNYICPYEGSETSRQILSTIKYYLNDKIDLRKKFYDLPYEVNLNDYYD